MSLFVCLVCLSALGACMEQFDFVFAAVRELGSLLLAIKKRDRRNVCIF